MSDELTPEEQDALKNLPRERMPSAGLEERVVGAMHERGFLARRRRAIEITGGRVAGVLVASVVLLIGAYSVGVHRGGGAISPVPVTLESPARESAPAGGAELKVESNALVERPAAPPEKKGALDKAMSARGAVRPSDRPTPQPVAVTTAMPKPLTFILNGVPLTIESPDSVQVVEDARGRTLIIHTSDGIIRIRLANDR